MAISHVGTQTVDQAGANQLTIPIPGGATTDDLMIAFVKQSENTTGRVWDDDGGGGNGWAQLAYNRTTGGRDQETSIYWKIHDGSESNPTFTWQLGVTAEPMSGSIEVYRGVDTTDPISDFAYANAQNDANPPNPTVAVSSTSSAIVVYHAATHDDISSPSAPTGYTMRGQVWSGTANDHRNLFIADLLPGGALGSYTPPDWQHSVLNTTPEYHTYTLVLQEPVLIQVDDFNTSNVFTWGAQNLVLNGFGFEAVQGTGKVEMWDDLTGTTKVLQTVDSWADGSIQIDTVQGSLPNNESLYLVVTNDNGDESAPLQVTAGLLPYSTAIANLNPDHNWSFDGNYNDTAGVLTRNASVNQGAPGFTANPLTRGRTQSFRISAQSQRIEIADSVLMNAAALAARSMGGWITISQVQDSFVCFYEEGGGVNNLAFFMGMGGILIAQLADTGDDNVHAYSDFPLEPDRRYRIDFRFDYNGDSLFELLVDGELQVGQFGNPLTSSGNHLDSHVGDAGWGDAEGQLEVFSTNVTFPAAVTSDYQDWNSWTRALTTAEIRTNLFELGVRGDIIITEGTQAAMQTALDAYADTVRPNSDCTFVIEGSTDGDFSLDFDNITFNQGTTLQIQYRGIDTLTANNLNGSNLEAGKMSTPLGGTVTIITPATLTLVGLQNPTEVRVFEAGTETEIAGQEAVTTGTFSATVEVASVDMSILSLGYLNQQPKAVDTSSTITLPIQQFIDRQYENL